MNYTQEKIDKLYETYVKNYVALSIIRGAHNLTEIFTRDEFFKKYLEEKEKKGITMNVMQNLVRSHIKK